MSEISKKIAKRATRAGADGVPETEAKEKSRDDAESSSLRAFTVLESVIASREPPSLDDVTRMCDMPKPTVFRILGILQKGGLLHREPISRTYSAGHRLVSLAMSIMNSASLRMEREAILRRLVDEIGETCNFTMLDGNQVLYLDRVETKIPLRLHLDSGVHVPLHCTASGKLFLSQLSSKHVYRLLGKGPYPRWTPYTITDPGELEAALKLIRKDMIGTDDREADHDSVCVAVPIMAAKGRVYAAVAMHAPAFRMTLDKALEYVPALRRAALAFEETLASTTSPVSPEPVDIDDER